MMGLKLEEIVGTTRVIPIQINKQKCPIPNRSSEFFEPSLGPPPPANKGTDILAELFVDSMNFRGIREAFIVRLKQIKNEDEKPVKEGCCPTSFSFNEKRHCYIRSIEGSFKAFKHDLGKSKFDKNNDAENTLSVFYKNIMKI